MSLYRAGIVFPRCSSLCLLITVYAILFAVAGVLLLQLRYSRHGTTKPSNYEDSYVWEVDRWYSNESGVRWPVAAENHLFGCLSLKELTDLEFVAAGWTKAVYKGIFRGQNVAVKTVNLNGKDMRECDASMSVCYRRAAAKILKEIVLLTELAHDNVVTVIGSCVPETVGPVAIVTELGEPLDTVRLLQLSWEDRLRLALGIAHILHHLATSPLGSLSMNDFRRQQFVLVGGTLKLSDVDDIGVGEPECTTDDDCVIKAEGVHNVTREIRLSCHDSHCVGYNERLNVLRAGQHFISLFLPLSAPASLEPQVQELLRAYKEPGTWETAHILSATEHLVHKFASGEYLQRHVPQPQSLATLGFEKLRDRDLPGEFDYHCHHSSSSVVCIKSVMNEIEAAEICAKDSGCRAVVMGHEYTWTGRTLAVFKNGCSFPSERKGYTLLIKKDEV